MKSVSLNHIIGKLYPRSVGLQINLEKDNTLKEMVVVIIQKTGESAQIIDSFSTDNLSELKNKLKTSDLLHIAFYGKGVITKLLPVDYIDNPISGLFPNAPSSEFYVCKDKNDPEIIVSTARCSTIDIVLLKLNECGIYPRTISLGLNPIFQILPLITDYNTLDLPDCSLEINDGSIRSIRKGNNKRCNYSVGSYDLDSKYLLPLALSLKEKESSAGSTDYPQYNFQATQSKFKSINRKVAISTIALFFVVLLINSIVNIEFNKKHNELSKLIGENIEVIQRVNALELDITRKEDLLDNLSESQKIFSYVSDRIGASLPRSIKLSSMELSPIKKSSKKILAADEVIFEDSLIIVSGTCQRSENLSNWIETLNDKWWIHSITISDFSEIEGHGSFEFEIILKTSYEN